MTRKARVVGIDRYPSLKNSQGNAQNLTYPAADGEAIACLLRKCDHFEVKLLPETCPDGANQVDEKGQLKAKTLYARSLKGQRVLGIKPLKRGENLTLIGAFAKKGVSNTFAVNGGTTAKVFKVYVEKVLVPSLWPGAIVVTDNLPAQKVEGVEEMIKAPGAKVSYLSPYSRDFNPIENLWSKLKEYLRSVGVRTREALEVAINQGLDMVSLKKS